MQHLPEDEDQIFRHGKMWQLTLKINTYRGPFVIREIGTYKTVSKNNNFWHTQIDVTLTYILRNPLVQALDQERQQFPPLNQQQIFPASYQIIQQDESQIIMTVYVKQ